MSQVNDTLDGRPQVFVAKSYEPGREAPYPAKSLIYFVPLMAAWHVFSQIFMGDQVTSQLSFRLIGYISVIITALVVFDLLMKWMPLVDKETKALALVLVWFMALYLVGLEIAQYVPDFDTLRRNLVSNYSPVLFALTLLLAPPQLGKLRRYFEVIIMVTAFVVAGNLWYEFLIHQGGEYIQGREGGIFDQANVTGAWVSIGLALWLYKNDSPRYSSSVVMAVGILFTLAVSFTGSLSSAIQVFLFWQVYFISRIRRSVLRDVLTIVSALIVFFGWRYISSSNEPFENVINYRVTAVLNTMRFGNSTYLDAGTSVSVRWAASVEGVRQLPHVFIQGYGLTQHTVYVEYMQAGFKRAKHLPPHNTILTTWLESGLLGAGPYILFIIFFSRFLYSRFKQMGLARWGNAFILVFLLGVFTNTDPFSSALTPVLFGALCLATGDSRQRLEPDRDDTLTPELLAGSSLT